MPVEAGDSSQESRTPASAQAAHLRFKNNKLNSKGMSKKFEKRQGPLSDNFDPIDLLQARGPGVPTI